jgi:uncharacterized protein (TIGR02594 family)
MKDLILYGLSEFYGIDEISGANHNPLILQFFHEIGHKWVKDDETAWCAAVHSYIHKKCGYQYTGKLNARSWEDFGEKLEKPEFGCTVVFWRMSKTSGYGHVGLFIRENINYVWVLGGNQSNSYNISKYSKEQLLGYRKISKNESKTEKTVGMAEREENNDSHDNNVINSINPINPTGIYPSSGSEYSNDNWSSIRGSGIIAQGGENSNRTEPNPLPNKSEKEIDAKIWFLLKIPLNLIINLFKKK